MKRLSAALLVLGALLLVAGLLVTLLAGAISMPSYLAGWLFWAALPIGALPVVMLLDLAGAGSGSGLEVALRRLLLLLPLAAVLMIPVLISPGSLFGWATGHGFSTPLGQAWMHRTAFVVRSVIYFVIWTGLGLVFLSSPAPEAVYRRRGMAAVGLFVFVLSATLASVDWAMAVEPAWYSSEYGLLFVATEAAIAVSFALLLVGPAWREAFPEAAAAVLLVAAAAWVFMQFIQYLVIWSADKPSDITWYLHRTNPGSDAAVWIGFVGGFVIPLCLLQSPRLRRRPWVLPTTAVLMLCAQALGVLWLITPSLRHSFTISWMDILEFAGVGGVTLGAALWPEWPAKPAAAAAQHG